jgi:hypothetical protein
MILLALLLAAIGTADLVRARARPGLARGLAPVIAGALVVVVGVLACSVEWWWAIATLPVLLLWLAGTSDRRSGAAGYWAVGGLGAVAAIAVLAVAGLPVPSGGITRWYAALPYQLTADVALETVALAIGGVLFLLESSNVVVRIALRGTGAVETTPTGAAPPRRRWWGGESVPVAVPAAFSSLKGGRIIGPLERLFLLTLALSGQFTAIAAVIAAKGIIRFPEISRDQAGGSKAEYFLVGSFTSWTLVLAVGLLVTLTVGAG